MKITFLVHDISSNIVWAATALARALRPRYDVEIVGPDMGEGVSPMFRAEFSYTAVPAPKLYRLPEFFSGVRKLRSAVSGDVIFAMKSYMDTVPVALWHQRKSGKKVVVYLDEWDGANYYRLSPVARAERWLRHFYHPLDDAYFPCVEKKIPRADAVVCSSTFLQRKFGGRLMPLGVDTQEYRPQPADAVSRLRDEVGLEGRRLIVFGGVVRKHKGVETILNALIRINDDRLRLLIVGPMNEDLWHISHDPRYEPWLILAGAQPKEKMPLFLGLADLIALPLADNLLSQSQVPCKVFEAMSMAKPVIASAVSDLPRILEGCGWVIPPSNVEALADAILYVVGHPAEARAKGDAAREKCIREYSTERMGQTLIEVVESLR